MVFKFSIFKTWQMELNRYPYKLNIYTWNCVSVNSKVWVETFPDASATFNVMVTIGEFSDLHSSLQTAIPNFHVMSTSCKHFPCIITLISIFQDNQNKILLPPPPIQNWRTVFFAMSIEIILIGCHLRNYT